MKLRWYQEAAVEAIWDSVRYGKCNPCCVVPTGGGKSLIIAELCRMALGWDGRVLVLQHRKELIQQNAEKIRLLLPDVPVGIFSAGLKSKETKPDIVVAGIQSAYQHAHKFDRRHVVIVDEAHLIPNSETTMYRTFLDELSEVNPGLRIIGLTATPYRTGEGLVTDGGVLDQICYEVPVRQLIQEGFLCELTSKSSERNSVSMAAVHVRRGEFVQKEMEDAFLAGRRVQEACKEIVTRCHDRRSVLVFTSGVAHAERVRGELETLTAERVDLVTGQTLPLERAASLQAFKEGRLRWLVNVDVLTTGFDAPNIDAIAVLRATQSPGLFAQICGRGFRIHDGKTNCKILDFGGNIDRHGPLDSPLYGRISACRTDGKGEAPMRDCPECGRQVPLGNRWCVFCGEMLRDPDLEIKHESKPDESGNLLTEPQWQNVLEVKMSRHIPKKIGKWPTLRVNYVVQSEDGGNLAEKTISEWVCIEHEGYAREKAITWWKEHSIARFPFAIDECISLFNRGAMRMPSRILAIRDGYFWRVLGREFDEERPTNWNEEENNVDFGELAF
jgi:DNA repair protein RadD